MKAQEFDVFKLLISVIVGGAILMILMQVLNQLNMFGSDLKSVIKAELNACGGDCSQRAKSITLNVEKGTKICYDPDLKDTPATDVTFESDFKELIKSGDCLEAEEAIKGKKARLLVSCTNGVCTVKIAKP